MLRHPNKENKVHILQGRGGSRRVSYRKSHRGRREAVPEISDEEAVRYITQLLQEYQAAHQ